MSSKIKYILALNAVKRAKESSAKALDGDVTIPYMSTDRTYGAKVFSKDVIDTVIEVLTEKVNEPKILTEAKEMLEK